jgi:hypothetical protein
VYDGTPTKSSSEVLWLQWSHWPRFKAATGRGCAVLARALDALARGAGRGGQVSAGPKGPALVPLSVLVSRAVGVHPQCTNKKRRAISVYTPGRRRGRGGGGSERAAVAAAGGGVHVRVVGAEPLQVLVKQGIPNLGISKLGIPNLQSQGRESEPCQA